MKFAYVDYETTNELGMRWYLTPHGALPSITTVLSATESTEKKNSLENWRQSLGVQEADAKSKKATEHGTMVHLLAERFFRGQEVLAPVDGLPVLPEDVAAFNALKLKLRQVTEVWGQEQSVYSPTLQLAGRFDLAGCYRQVPSILDFKTAGRVKHRKDVEDYELQLAFYATAHNEQFGTDIQQGVILMSSAGGMPQEFIVDIKARLPELKHRVALFWEKTLARF